MTTLIAALTSAKAAKIAGVAAALLAVGFTTKIDYDADNDELTIRLRKVRPLLGALQAAPKGAHQ